MLKVRALTGERNHRTLFSKVTFEVPFGSALCVLGENGSGKSSLLKLLAGLATPLSGQRFWKEKAYQESDPNFLSDLLYIGHQLGLQSGLTPLENLAWLSNIGALGSTGKEARQAALNAVGLSSLENRLCEQLSQGQQQRVALARLWLNPPLCWILDEPFTGLDKAGVDLVCTRFLWHLQRGGVLVFATHQPIQLEGINIQTLTVGDA